MTILQVSSAEIGGGAERIAYSLFTALRERGERSLLAVGRRASDDPDVFVVPKALPRDLWYHACVRLAALTQRHAGKVRGAGLLYLWARLGMRPLAGMTRRRGREDFSFPGTRRLLAAGPAAPDLLHCHNLHAAPGKGFFDLRALPALSRQVPVVLTLHDAWLLSGHCSHSFGCERWRTGCGHCPDLGIYPALEADGTAANWEMKRRIFARSRLHVATPSRWLMERVEQSMLWPAVASARVIPNGMDLDVFRPGDRLEARRQLGLPPQARILLFAANGVRANRFKDYETLRAAIARVAARREGEDVLFVALGDDGPPEAIGAAQVQFVPFCGRPAEVARYYRAADVYLHAARADTFPNTVLESLASGTPVVATAVGGIPEQVRDGETGMLVPPGAADAMADAVARLLDEDAWRARLGAAAAQDAQERFSLQRMVDSYLAWYGEVLSLTEVP